MLFASHMLELKTSLEAKGWSALTPEISEASREYTSLPENERLLQKRAFISQHFKKIKAADAILVANCEKNNIEGYIGANTLMEIAAAHLLQKQILILNKLGDQSCKEEVRALATTFLNGDLSKINNK